MLEQFPFKGSLKTETKLVLKTICGAMKHNRNQHRLNMLNANRLTIVLHVKAVFQKAYHIIHLNVVCKTYSKLLTAFEGSM